VAVVRALLAGDGWWLAVVVALNVVIGLAYYLRVAVRLYTAPAPQGEAATAVAAAEQGAPLTAQAGSGAPSSASAPNRAPLLVGVTLAAATLLAVLVGFAPQLVLDIAGFAALR